MPSPRSSFWQRFDTGSALAVPHIEHIVISGIGPFSSLEWAPDPHLNVVHVLPGTGATTWLKCVHWAACRETLPALEPGERIDCTFARQPARVLNETIQNPLHLPAGEAALNNALSLIEQLRSDECAIFDTDALAALDLAKINRLADKLDALTGQIILFTSMRPFPVGPAWHLTRQSPPVFVRLDWPRQ